MASPLTVSRTEKPIRGWRCKSNLHTAVNIGIPDYPRLDTVTQKINASSLFYFCIWNIDSNYTLRIITADLKQLLQIWKGYCLGCVSQLLPTFQYAASSSYSAEDLPKNDGSPYNEQRKSPQTIELYGAAAGLHQHHHNTARRKGRQSNDVKGD